MARPRRVVHLAIPAVIVVVLALLVLWRLGPSDDRGQLVGTTGLLERHATLEAVQIRQRTSDMTFWVGPIDRPIFAVVDPSVRRAAGVTLDAGKTFTLVGDVRPVPSTEEMSRAWRVDAATADSVHQLGTYLRVTEIR